MNDVFYGTLLLFGWLTLTPVVVAQGPEGYFNGSAFAILRNTLDVRYVTSLGFRTCSHGLLFHQSGANGDSLKSEVTFGGRLRLHWNSSGKEGSVEVGHDFNDNKWHNMLLRYSMGQITLTVDDQTSVAANSTYNNELLHLDLLSPNPEIVVGQGFEGCLLQGAGLVFGEMTATSVGVNWTVCPLPDRGDCDGYRVNYCFSQPCHKHGTCTSMPEGYQCTCTARYAGVNCETDTGPLCEKPRFNRCQNGGICQEESTGNSTMCACPPKFTGQFCEIPIDARLCDSNPCHNNATCHLNQYGDAFECKCLPGFAGLTCEIDIDECDLSPCQHGGKCVDGVNTHQCDCDTTGYRGQFCEENIDECAESNQCLNGGRCFDTYGNYFCECRRGLAGKNCEQQVNECSSSPCRNAGTCLNLLNRYQCTCPAGLQGTDCEINVDDCLGIRCPENARCVDDINSYKCVCNDGFHGSAQNCTNVDECAQDPCANGGTCQDEVGSFRCFCAPGFTGATCSESIDECTSNPCHNGATCIDQVGHFECNCPPGFTGPSCSVDVDECVSAPCVHGGRCEDVVGDYRCHCAAGFTGKNCETDVDECLSAPCQHGATCHNVDGNFTCSCLPGFTGWFCEVDIDDCVSAPCVNGGTCVDEPNKFRCQCPAEFDGPTCAQPYDDCVAQPCKNGATCLTRPPEHQSTCTCVLGFAGDRCEVNIDDCVDVTCPQGFVCVDLVNSHECKCPPGFDGPNCEQEVDECLAGPCQNGGTCLDGVANFTCRCPVGYTGRHCEDDVDECAVETKSPCVHGICSNRLGTYQCYCQPGFSGSNCDREYDECLSRPCRNGASCQDMVNDYMCLCVPGYTGKECETDINECDSAPCLNGGSCQDQVANFTCDCMPGFTGKRCEVDIDECASNPCQNEGVCTDKVNGFVCNCADTGFTGEFCQDNIDDCALHPCVNDGNCTDLIKAYSCTCHPGYSGPNCEVDVAECEAHPCLNGAQCYDKSNRSIYEEEDSLRPPGFPRGPFKYSTSGGYLCICKRGFTGDDCEINIDDCVHSPCINGQCVDGIDSYECSCHRGFEGRHCEVEIDECRRYRPCAAGAVCLNLVGDYHCRCPPGIGGKNCTVPLRGCDDNDCVHGGTCIPFLIGEDQHARNCSCTFGYYGTTCEMSTTMSFDWKQHHRLLVMGSASEDYRLSLRFRTTIPDGLLAYGHGSESFLLYLRDGAVNFHIASETLSGNGSITLSLKDTVNDGQWWSLHLTFPQDNVVLQLTNGVKTVWQNVTSQLPSQVVDGGRVYVATYVARAGDRMRLEVGGFNIPGFVGCMQDVTVSDETVVPGGDSSRTGGKTLRYIINVKRGCTRTEQCLPSTCNYGGDCVDLWTDYSCRCVRPHFGLHCEFEYEAATFNHENLTDSHAIVTIPPAQQASLKHNSTISMFIRTRRAEGLVFYLGNGNSLDGAAGGDTFLAAELESGVLRTSVKINGTPESLIDKKGRRLDDGYHHLVEVSLVNRTLSAAVNGSSLFAMAIEANGETALSAFHLILGGLPVVPVERLFRTRRQLIHPADPHVIVGPHRLVRPSTNYFKGVMQDIRLNDWLVNLFISRNVTYPQFASPLDYNITLHNVIFGVQSDDTCRTDPCQNDSNCTVTWNDYVCQCPVGFRGKNCTEVEYCAFNRCPHLSECRSLSRGYECISNGTFNGMNSSLILLPHLSSSAFLDSISFHLRTKTGGPVVHLRQGNNSLEFSFSPREMRVGWHLASGRGPSASIPHSIIENDSLEHWHTINVSIGKSALTVHVDNGHPIVTNVTPLWTPSQMLLDDLGRSRNDVAVEIGSGVLGDHYRGCLREIRIGDVLLPFIPRHYLTNDTSDNYFVADGINNLERECLMCYQSECQHNSVCLDQHRSYDCNCSDGYNGQFCEVDIDECAGVVCENGGTCHDRPAAFHCQCVPGFDGERCEHEIDECASDPCQHGGTCIDLLNFYSCNCSANYTGVNCEKEKTFDCSSHPCLEGSTCENVFVSQDILYRCICPFGRTGLHCESDIDYCAMLPCHNGGTCLSQVGSYECTCARGYEGMDCEQKIDYCSSNPCHNSADCTSKEDAFECHCTKNFRGPLCADDIDECMEGLVHCQNGGTCNNLIGGFECVCTHAFTGLYCEFPDLCTNTTCKNGGTCVSYYSEESNKVNCTCPPDFEGPRCEKPVPSHSGLDTELLAIIIGSVVGATVLIVAVALTVFLTMARKKRATRGTYSPSRQEMFGSRVELGHVMKPPPEERLI